jgi:hypothetical protein
MAGALRHRPSIWLVVKRSSSATVIHKCVSNPSVLIYNNYEINFSNHFFLDKFVDRRLCLQFLNFFT